MQQVGDMFRYGSQIWCLEDKQFAKVVKITDKQIHFVIIEPAKMNVRYEDNRSYEVWEISGNNPDNETGYKVIKKKKFDYIKYDGHSIITCSRFLQN